MDSRIYKLYNIQINANYQGVGNKIVCDIEGHRGIFKLPLMIGSKDHIIEEVCYRLATLTNIPCAFAKVRNTSKGIGVFSRFEIPKDTQFVHASTLYNAVEMHVSHFIEETIRIFGAQSTVTYKSIQLIIFDFLTGQLDRHMMNIAILKDQKGKIDLYKLYDNGIALYSIYANDIAIQWLNGFEYNGRMGSSIDLYETIAHITKSLGTSIENYIDLAQVNYDGIKSLILQSDRFNELNNERTNAMARFICHQASLLKEI